MTKAGRYFSLLLIIFFCLYYFLPRPTTYHLPLPTFPRSSGTKDAETQKLKTKAVQLKKFARTKHFSTEYCFLLDMSLPSGRKRFFIYDFRKDSMVASGLAAHGSCNSDYLVEAKFSNTPGCGCSAKGKYKVGYSYHGRFGKAFKLFGLDSTNNKAFMRNIVLHAYSCIPDNEIYPQFACNSLGCPMVSYKFLETAAGYINVSNKPILLWVFD